MFDAVIFDWDGTLADTKDVIVLAFQKVLSEAGCRVSDEFLERRIGTGARNMFEEALRKADLPYDEEVIERLLEKKTSIHAELSGRIELIDGAVNLLDSLNHRVKMALATMSNRKVMDKLLNEKEIRHYFDLVITADDVDQPKPDPEVFLKCTARLKCQPENCVVVEDSIFGVMAAKKAKMRCIVVPSGSYSKEELEKEGPDLIVDSIKEKDKILEYVLGEKPEP